MITYNDIYEAARKERYSNQLQPIPKRFVSEVSNYFKEKKQLCEAEEKVSSDSVVKTKKQLENATIFFKELIVRRRKKILDLVLIATETGIAKQDFENMLAFEKELFEELMKCMDLSDSKLNEMLSDETSEKVEANEMIIFKENVECFVGLNAEQMGPFEKGQIANIPKEITKILVEGGKAERVHD